MSLKTVEVAVSATHTLGYDPETPVFKACFEDYQKEVDKSANEETYVGYVAIAFNQKILDQHELRAMGICVEKSVADYNYEFL